jgi:hypothetical protein
MISRPKRMVLEALVIFAALMAVMKADTATMSLSCTFIFTVSGLTLLWELVDGGLDAISWLVWPR